MLQKKTWSNSLRRMSKTAMLICFSSIISLFKGCDCEDCGGKDGNYQTKATIKFINETSNLVVSEVGCERDVEPNGILIFEFDERLGTKPDINNFPVSVFYCEMMYKDGDILKCESGVENIENYEDRKEVSPLVFEFTFRFTDEKKAIAEPCN